MESPGENDPDEAMKPSFRLSRPRNDAPSSAAARGRAVDRSPISPVELGAEGGDECLDSRMSRYAAMTRAGGVRPWRERQALLRNTEAMLRFRPDGNSRIQL